MKKRFFLIPILAIALATGALLFTRGGGSSGGSAEASAQVAAAFASLEELTSFSMHQTMVMKIDGDFIEIELEIEAEGQDRVYAKSSSGDDSAETVILGEDVFIKREGQPWASFSLEDLGMNPDAVTKSNEQTFLPPELRVLGEVDEDGAVLVHYEAELDADELLDTLSSAFLEDSPIRRGLSEVSIEKLEVEYFVGKDDQLPYRGSLHMVMSAQGERVEVWSGFEYLSFNQPVILPADLPITP